MEDKKIINGVLHAVAAIVYNDKNQILMFDRKGEEWETGWEVIKGAINFGEKSEEAVIREINEEAGINVEIVKKIPKIFWDKQPYKYGELKIHVEAYLCKYLSGQVKLGEPEHIDHKWVSLEEAKEKIWFSSGKELLNHAGKELNNLD